MIEFSVDLFNGLIGNMQAFRWRRSFACPCINPASGASKPSCPFCNGKGRMWDDEVDCEAGVQNIRNDKGFAQFGTWQPGDALFTVGSDSPLYAAGQYDRMRAVNATTPFSTVIIPGENDKLLGTVQSISRVFWLNDAGDTVVEGLIPTVNPDGSLSWTSGAPPDGVQYCVTGVKFVEFFIYMNMPSNRNMNLGSLLPRKFQARLFDLFGR